MILLVRHGESEWNRAFNRTRVDPGIRDPVLTDTGRTQALSVAVDLNARGVRTLLASPYRRALETASIIAASAKPSSAGSLCRMRAGTVTNSAKAP